MLKVHISPNFHKPDKADGGIRRVWEAQVKHLPQFDVEFTPNPDEAQVIANHGSAIEERSGIPTVNHNHGLYWSRYPWGEAYQEANRQVINTMVRSVAHTCPSEWVATALRRGMLIYPEVVYHGVDIEDWEPAPSKNYILWNKARHDMVSDVGDMFKVAQLLPHRQFVSTIGNPASNVSICGIVPFEQMKTTIQEAGVYLATPRETFGIGTLEAMACGVPIAGWNWGGQSEIIIHGETGYLANPGDYDGLAHCIEQCLLERERLGANAREDVRNRWGWERRIEQYANLYKRVYNWWYSPRPRISVIVTAYNMERYLVDCLKSVQKQSINDFECIVVDDYSEDGTQEIAEKFCYHDKRFKYYRPEHNLGLCGARNLGFTKASGRYIRYLDADDILEEHCLELEAKVLDDDKGVHITYGHLQNIKEDGTPDVEYEHNVKDAYGTTWPPPQFSWRQQMAHLNQLPSCAMLRREVMERTGGYRLRHWRNEDAAFWCYVSSLGFRIQKACNAVTYYHRMRNDSKGMTEFATKGGELDWTAWFPWRIAGGQREAMDKWAAIVGRQLPDPKTVPFGAQGIPPKGIRSWFIHDYAYPNVSVICTVGPQHERFVIDAVESVLAQTYPDWELIVVNDTGEEWPEGFDSPIAGAPYAKLYNTENGPRGASHARNLGAKYARAPLLVWLDADDYWLPNFLERMVAMYEANDGIIYSDLLQQKKGYEEPLEPYGYPEFECGRKILTGGMTCPGSSILVPRWVHEKIVAAQGGWDESIVGMEDWDYQIAAQVFANACSYHIDEPLFVYRFTTGTKREKDYEKVEDIVKYIRAKYSDYWEGHKDMGCGCSKKSSPSAIPRSAMMASGNFNPPSQRVETNEVPADAMILVEYNGPRDIYHLRGRGTGKRYKFGRAPGLKQKWVYWDDAQYILENIIEDNIREFTVVDKSKV